MSCVLFLAKCTAGYSSALPWSKRMKIAVGAAKGLAFLHEADHKPVIFRDFKTSNILLDSVSYFFLSELSYIVVDGYVIFVT